MVTRNGPTPSLVYSRWWRPVWQPTQAYNGVRYGPKSAWVRAIGGVLSGCLAVCRVASTGLGSIRMTTHGASVCARGVGLVLLTKAWGLVGATASLVLLLIEARGLV